MRKMKKALAVMLAATMTMSMGMTALAASTNPGTDGSYHDEATIVLKKNYKLGENVASSASSPAETFTFENIVCTNVEDAGADIGPNDAPVPDLTNVSVSYDDGEATKGGFEKNITITLPSLDEYPSVGVYTYTFNEVDNHYAGVTYRPESKVITLKVTIIDDGNKRRVAAVHAEETGGTKTDTFDNTYSAGELVIRKDVTGYLGDTEKEFLVNVTLETLDQNDKVMADITYTDLDGKHTIAAGTAGWNKTSVQIRVKSDTEVTFENVPYDIKYTVVEQDYSDDGYEVTYDGETVGNVDVTVTNEKTGEDETVSVLACTGTVDSANERVGITNNKDGDGAPDTGIVLDNAPYILLLALAALGMFGFVSKKRSMEF